jgi:hypothetical protein
MERNSYTNGSNMGIRKSHKTGELQLYAPYIRREINCNIAIIEAAPY